MGTQLLVLIKLLPITPNYSDTEEASVFIVRTKYVLQNLTAVLWSIKEKVGQDTALWR
jgi:hypothetical protein